MLTYIQIIHCLNNKISIQNTENKAKYMYTENLQLLKKTWAAKEKHSGKFNAKKYYQTYFSCL